MRSIAESGITSLLEGAVQIDGHVHLHPCYPLETALDAAVENFVRRSTARPAAGALWLVERSEEGAAERLRSLRTTGEAWRLEEASDVTWRLHRSGGKRLTLIRGRQVVTTEGLEVLVVGTAEPIPDGRPLFDVVTEWLDREVLLMLPWGFGKWSGRRGRLVERAHEEFATDGLRLADSAARPALAPSQPLLAREADAGRFVPVGSDPFPFPGRVGDVGRFGFVVPDLDRDAEWPAMLRAVRRLGPEARPFGRRFTLREFVTLQLRMQLRKRIR